ncbi:hypothetical protein ACFQJC_14440 [Haloferax namakaokahaiae]|uniref:Preprotein translocase subunit TatA n=1 Tax=Haloferax namakaokahaiae TaxID=1748331 RepID=A0ABD5ZIG5_9EURY
MIPLFPGIPGGSEVFLVFAVIIIPIYVAYRVLKWGKHIVEKAVE